ncbi:MAG: hypothetical protein JO288_05960 [Hyphomicrobiales bacterium]|nr:hypothetical protein [Hyphomicrobiales bacterium]
MLLRGLGLDAIGAEEKAPVRTVQAIVQDELDRRWVPPAADFAKLQIARLERLAQHLADSVERAESKAVDRMLKILDRLDRYHGFTRLSPAGDSYDQDARVRLLEKINAIAERLDDPEDEEAAGS